MRALAEFRRGRGGRCPARAPAGLTLIEAVLAVAMLALVASAMFRVFDTVARASLRQERRLACAELCNRLILQYLDDAQAMPSPSLPIPYGDDPRGDLYRWELDVRDAEVELVPEMIELEETTPALRNLVERGFQQLTIRVWLSEESGGAYGFHDTSIRHEIVRPMDPLAMRNPDTLQSILNSPNGIERFIQLFSGLAPPPPQGGNNPPGGAPTDAGGGGRR